jgi:hypothetical protein
MKAYRVAVEGQECIVFEISSLRARAVAAKEFRKWYRCSTYPETTCKREPQYDGWVTDPGRALVESSLGECAPKEAFGGGD